jgi:transcription factor SFP1
MEKEKPYRCEVCGKRYKNLNGLKYHKAHSPPCNPEMSKLPNAINAAAGMPPVGTQGLPMNLGGDGGFGGLGGIGEESLVG